MTRFTSLSTFFLLGTILWGLPGLSQTPIAHFSFDNDSDSTKTKELISNTDFDILNARNRPERIQGISGQALRLDGYSTNALKTGFQLSGISNRMAVELWFTPEAYNNESAGLVSQIGTSEGFAVEVSPLGAVIFEGYADGIRFFARTTKTLDPYKWHHIVAQIDLVEEEAKIYVNGQLWKTQAVTNKSQLTLSGTSFLLGRSNESVIQAGFNLTHANGALDEIRVYNSTLTDAQILAAYTQDSGLVPDLSIDPRIRFAEDHLRPRYHVMPNTSWANESYGLTWYDGKYHMFFQKNPNAPQLYYMHWGHVSSPDLVQWKEEKMPLRPSEGFDNFGVWSGTTTFDTAGVPVICYTGVTSSIAGIGMAYPQDDSLISWVEEPANPVIDRPPSSFAHLDFRDPYIWQDSTTGDYYMIVGSGIQSDGGILFTYRSSNLVNWILRAPLYRDRDINRSGRFWEMPAFIPVSETEWMLLVNPTPDGQKGASANYWIGTWAGDAQPFVPYDPEPKQFVHLRGQLLSPAIGKDENGDWAYIGIIPEDRNVNDQIAAGWRQTFSLPRIMRKTNDTLIAHIPHPNLCRLRQNNSQISSRMITPGTGDNLPEFAGNQTEIQARIVPSEASTFSLQILKNDAGTEFTSITFDLKNQKLGIDRRFSSPFSTLENNRFAPYLFSDTIDVRVFIDHSVLEVFVDNLTVMSARVYPGAGSLGMDLVVSEGQVDILQMDVWDLADKESTMLPDTICDPGVIPDQYHTVSLERWELENGEISIYPNPSTGKVIVESQLPSYRKNLMLSVFDLTGRLVTQRSFDGYAELNLQSMPEGCYLLRLDDGTYQYTHRLILQR